MCYARVRASQPSALPIILKELQDWKRRSKASTTYVCSRNLTGGSICQGLSKEGLRVSPAAWRNSVVIGMQFCPKCRLALTPTKKEKIVVLTCPKCGQESKRSDPVVQKLERAKESIVVIGKGQNVQTLPTLKVNCQKCGHGEAFYWIVQTRGGDEASTQFFRCTKCGATWRESS